GLNTPTARAQLLRVIVHDPDFDPDTRVAVYEAMRAKAAEVQDLVANHSSELETIFRPYMEARFGTSGRGERRIARMFDVMHQKGARAVDDVEALITQTESDRMGRLGGGKPFKGDVNTEKGQRVADSGEKAFFNHMMQRAMALKVGIRIPS